ncbi:hypothetical protein T07_10857 [Trichinella nelsoni]|uniref:Uncharacterized protein n=1 Tax=Trichinella nelsoni TaxID=6336 RepID=A0A0V0REJ8_9BILA|nr:hypothetical protein T07_10857 [Trichinella nelsoni]
MAVYLALLPITESLKCGKMCKVRKCKGYAPGYALGKILKISNFLKNSPRLSPQAMPQGK